jgi:subtilisin family serine protease
MIPLKGTNGDTLFITVTGVANEFNGKPHMLVQFLNRVPDRIGISVKANGGTVHGWQGVVVKTSGYYGVFTRYAFSWAREGDVSYTTGDLVSTRSGIAVAAYNSKVAFTNVSGQNLSYSGYLRGRIAAFSSMGPTADGRVKPDIAGPGMALASAVSSYDPDYQAGGGSFDNVVAQFTSPLNNRTYGFGMAGGTSMSAPATSGIVAMLLQINPQLSPAEIKALFTKTAITDAFTSSIPSGGSTTWGGGKVNAMGAIRELLNPTTGIVHSISSPAGLLFYPNPGTGRFTLFRQENTSKTASLFLKDYLGRMLKSIEMTSEEIELGMEDLASGLYFLEYRCGSERSVIRFEKK